MFKPLSLAIGLRYIRAKKRSHFVSFISVVAVPGIAIGVMVLITVLSVMNGFDDEIHHRFFGMVPEITISDGQLPIEDWQAITKTVKSVPGVRQASPYVGGQGLLTYKGRITPLVVTGVLPEEERKLISLDKKVVQGSLDKLNHFGILIGQELAEQFALRLGDKVTLMIPKASITIAGMVPRFKRFTVTGIFKAGSGFNFDSKLAFINLHDAQKLFQLGDGVSGVRVKLNKVYDAPLLSRDIAKRLDNLYYVGNWTEQFGAFFKAVKMEKTMMFLILLLIVAVAAFNLVSSLVMVVNDKQAEIAILRTIGATPRLILMTFIVQGSFVGVIGTSLGLIFGLLLAYNATHIVDVLQQLFHVNVFASNVYFVDYLPSKIEWLDIVTVCFSALFMSFLATIYPAYKASNIEPSETLRYE